MEQGNEQQTELKEPVQDMASDSFPVPPPIVPTDSDTPVSYPSFLNEESSSTNEAQITAPVLPQQSDSLSDDASEKPTPPVVPETPENSVAPVIPVSEDESISESENISVPEQNTSTDQMTGPLISSTVVSDTPVSTDTSDTTSSADSSMTPTDTPSSSEATTDNTSAETSTEQTDTVSENKNSGYKSATFLDDLFANGNECITLPTGSFPVKEDTRALLALFSNGRFFVAENSRFDGKVLGFEYLARKRHLQIGKPEYVPTMVIGDIYDYANRMAQNRFVPPTVEDTGQDQVRMQRDFVTIITKAASQHVSDIHFVVSDHTTVMFRINGLMQTEMEYNKEWGESFVRAAFASADISDANYAQNEYQAAQKLGRTPLRGSGGRLILPRNVLGIRLQFNPIAFGTRYVVMRLLYAEDDVREASNLEALGFTKHEADIFYQLRSMPTGIVVISGPTGSGKSTTLQRNMISMLQERNYEINLITVEDPPEYPIPGARQMPVTNASIEEAKDREFTRALSAALRSDPDALMIGEIRALAAADLAFRGALSGHNVWTTIHANSAPAILMRLKDIGVEDFKLQDPTIMKGLMAQRLFRKLCPECRIKASDRLDNPAVQRLRRAFGDVALEQCYLKGQGCEACDFLGVKGRTVVGEFILPDATFLDLSIRGESKKAFNYWINDLNGMTLRDSAISRMLAGIIDIEEVERWTGFLDQQVLA